VLNLTLQDRIAEGMPISVSSENMKGTHYIVPDAKPLCKRLVLSLT
jgi:hypothetical protein